MPEIKYKTYRRFQGFEGLDKSKSEYDQIIEGMKI